MLHGDVLGERARVTPERCALVWAPSGQRFTYRQLSLRAGRCAALWRSRLGLSHGERVAILAHNRVEFLDAFFAAGRSGVVIVPLSTRATARELEKILRDAQVSAVHYDGEFNGVVQALSGAFPGILHWIALDEPALPHHLTYASALPEEPYLPAAPCAPEDLYCLLYTSGTTGAPKGVMVPHRMVAWNGYNTAACWGLREDDVSPIFTPLYHAGGLGAFLLPIFVAGGTIVLHRGFDPAQVWRSIVEHRCTVVLGVPTIWKLLAEAPEFASADLSHVRWFISGGAPLPVYLVETYRKRGVVLRQGYGLTEVGVNCFTMTSEEAVRKAGSIGKPMMFTQARVVDAANQPLPTGEVGELVFRGPHVSAGYWRNPEATASSRDSEGWFHTGDLARVDEEGFFYIAGRSKDMFISGGVNVYPAEVEAELLQHPGVQDAAVVGVPHDTWGEVGVAFLVRRPGWEVSGQELASFLADRLAKYKVPKEFIFVEELPRTPYGKVVKGELAERYLSNRLDPEGCSCPAFTLGGARRSLLGLHHKPPPPAAETAGRGAGGQEENNMRKPIYIAAYHQSKFGKLGAISIPEIIAQATHGVCAEIKADPAVLDVGSVGAVCNISLNEQGLLSGLLAEVPGMAAKPIEGVENACATGGQAILSVVYKLLLGLGEVGIAIGFEKMRDAEGKMDGKAVGKALGYFSHPAEREGKVYVFPHIFAEVMKLYMDTHGVSEEQLAQIAVIEYGNAKYNPYAQMQKVQPTLEEVMRIEGINRYVVDGLPLKTYDCSQISDGYAAMILATEEGLQRLGVAKADCVELAGYAQATDPLRKGVRDVLRPAGAFAAMNKAYEMAGVTPADVSVAEVHDCFTVMAAIAAEVLGKAPYGRGAAYWNEGKASVGGECPINTSGGLIAKGHPIGATGVAMVGWCAWQLLGKVPAELQVPNPKVAATFNIGGPICASVCTVLKPAS